MTETWVDGNEMAGALREVFAVDLTTARGLCVACGQMRMVAEARVYTQAPGLVARCPGCDAVLMRVVTGPGRMWLDMRGLTALELTLP